MCVWCSIHHGDSGLWLVNGNMLRDGAWSHRIQTTILHPGRGLGGLGGLWFFLPDSRGLLLGCEVVLAAAWLALLHAGGAGGHSDLSTTHCTLNRGQWSLWLEDESQ